MQTKIAKVQKYFKKKIEKCKFDSYRIEPKYRGFEFHVFIDGYYFNFHLTNIINNDILLYDGSFIDLNITKTDKLLKFAKNEFRN